MNIISFNVNGIRAIVGKSFIEDMKCLDPTIICLQETKATCAQVMETLSSMNDYTVFAHEADRKGYSGTAILTKIAPMQVTYGLGVADHDNEGRVICAEFEGFFLVTVYVPNSGSELARLPYRQVWGRDFLSYLKKLEAKKPIIVSGDFNVAHRSIDLARPKENYNKAAGYMQEEIDGMNAFIGHGFIDTFRFLNPEIPKYSWWSYRAGARQNNIGWRIDYFLASKSLVPKIKHAKIHADVLGSDHCPVSIGLDV